MTEPDKLSSQQLMALAGNMGGPNMVHILGSPSYSSPGAYTAATPSSGLTSNNYNPFTQSGMLNVSTAAAAPSSLSASQQLQRGLQQSGLGSSGGNHTGSMLMPPVLVAVPPSGAVGIPSANTTLLGGSGVFGTIGPGSGGPTPTPPQQQQRKQIHLMGGTEPFNGDDEELKFDPDSDDEVVTSQSKMDMATKAAKKSKAQQRSLVSGIVDDDPVEDFDSSLSDKEFFIVEDRNLALNPTAAAALQQQNAATGLNSAPPSFGGGGIRRKTQTGSFLERNTTVATTNFSANAGGTIPFNTPVDRETLFAQGPPQQKRPQYNNNNPHSQQPHSSHKNDDLHSHDQGQQQRGGQGRRHQSNSQQHMDPTNNLFICYLPFKMTDEQLLQLVRQQVAISTATENALRKQSIDTQKFNDSQDAATLSQGTSEALESTISLRAPSITTTNVPSPSAGAKEDASKDPHHPPAGAISAKIARHPDTNETKGFGFVLFATVDEAIKAKQALDGLVVGESKKLVVRYALPITDDGTTTADNTDDNSENRNIYVKGLPPSWGSPALREFFETRYGPVEDAIVLLHRGESKCLGLVLFKEIDDARKAVKDHGKAIIDGWSMPIQVRYSVPDTAKKRHDNQKSPNPGQPQQQQFQPTSGGRGRGGGRGAGGQMPSTTGRGHSSHSSGVDGSAGQQFMFAGHQGQHSPLSPNNTLQSAQPLQGYMFADPHQQQHQQQAAYYAAAGYPQQVSSAYSTAQAYPQQAYYATAPQALYADPFAQVQYPPFHQQASLAPPPPPAGYSSSAASAHSMGGLGSDLHRAMFSPPLSPFAPTGLGASSNYNSSTNSQQLGQQQQQQALVLQQAMPQHVNPQISAAHHAAAAAAAAKAAASYYHQLGLPVPPNLLDALNPQNFQQQPQQQQVWVQQDAATTNTSSSGNNNATNNSGLNTNGSYSSSGATPPNVLRSPQLRHNPYYAPSTLGGMGPMDLHSSSLSAVQMASPTATATSLNTPSSGTTTTTSTMARTNAIMNQHLGSMQSPSAQTATTASVSDAVAATLGLQPSLSVSQGSGQSGHNPLAPPPPPPAALNRKSAHSCRYCSNGCSSVVVYGLPTNKEVSETAAAKLLSSFGAVVRCEGMGNGVAIVTFTDKSAAMLAVQMLANSPNRLALLDCSAQKI